MQQLHAWITKQRGRAPALAKHLGIRTPMVWKMASGARPVPVARAAAIEQFTHGAVSRKDMFPDDYWHIWPDLAAPSQQEASHV